MIDWCFKRIKLPSWARRQEVNGSKHRKGWNPAAGNTEAHSCCQHLCQTSNTWSIDRLTDWLIQFHSVFTASNRYSVFFSALLMKILFHVVFRSSVCTFSWVSASLIFYILTFFCFKLQSNSSVGTNKGYNRKTPSHSAMFTGLYVTASPLRNIDFVNLLF